MRLILLLALLCPSVLLPRPVAAQDAPAWDDARALELVRRAQERRAEAALDTGLVSYRARAHAYVYFYLDREDSGERHLVKTDQLALEVLWRAPSLTKQRIIGWRDEESLPTNIHYHLDHLSVVQENFGDEIRIGDGDEVRGVVHPAAEGAEAVYQYRLGDSLTLRLPGAADPVRVYQLDVRPRDPRTPALVGSIFVERRRGDLVRMDFTFTAAAYVDRYLDYINISLDNGLWRGRHWLPNHQSVEIRRRLPQLDIPAGSVIRANMRVTDYEFNPPLAPEAFRGAAVVAVPPEEREAYPFEEDLHAELREEGLGRRMELSEIRAQAARLAREATLRRVSAVRPRIPAVSDVIRFNRAEGAVAAGAVAVRPAPGLDLEALAGYAFGAAHPVARLSVGPVLGRGFSGSAYLNLPREIGIRPAASGTLNTLSSLFAARDYTDPFYASGLELSARQPLGGGWNAEARGRLERHRSATLTHTSSVAGGDFRAVRPIDAAELFAAARLSLDRGLASEVGEGWGGGVGLQIGRASAPGVPAGAGGRSPAEPFRWVEPRAEITHGRRWPAAAAAVEVHGSAGALLGRPPLQELYLLGGRGTVPGYPFRAYAGDRFTLLSGVGSADLWAPWVRGRAIAAAGWAGFSDGGTRSAVTTLWNSDGTGSFKSSLGVGVGLFYDILRVDLVRGLSAGGQWEMVVETRPSFWGFL